MFKLWKTGLITFLSLLPILALAEVPSWEIVPSQSTLSFTATQNNAPITGTFKKFSGEIKVDPNELSSSHVKILVDISSISDVYNQLADTLSAAEWFDAKQFPHATFQSTEILKTGDKTYQVKGNLTIRDKTSPVTLLITQDEYTQTKGRITGTTTVKRTAFGVGQGDWKDTTTVKDDVSINFAITATKK